MSDDESKAASPSLRDRLLSKAAKIKGLELIQTIQMFGRDSRRLDARNRAVQRNLLGGGKAMSDDDNITLADTIRTGLAWKELGIVGLVLLGALWLFRRDETPAAPVPDVTPPPAVSPLDDREFEIRFFDQFGDPIKIPQRSEEPRAES